MYNYMLMDHQTRAIANPPKRRGYWWDCGTGKTLLGIELIKKFNVKTLVVCPLSIIEAAWMEDFRTFAPDIQHANLWALRQKRKNKSGNLWKAGLESMVGVINFESFRLSFRELLEQNYKMLIVDESSSCKQIKSKRTKLLISFSDSTDRVYLFSGTPAPNSKLEYWTQARMIDKGLFGKSFYAWRNNYCYSFGYGNYQWAMRKDKDQLFTDKLNTISEVVRKEDVLDLPGKTENIRDVQLDKYERNVYDTMKKDLIVEFGEKESVAANAAVKMMKLREATSGFLINNDGSISRTGESKLKELSSLLAEIGNHQVIIWTQFHYEAAQIMELLKGKSAVRIDGTIPNQNIKNANLQSFKSGDAQYLIAHPASLGHGVTLVNCNYAVYFSLSHSYELQVQSMDRIYRKGQHNCCTYYFLLAVNSVDKVIMKALKNKQSTAEAVLHYLQKKGDF